MQKQPEITTGRHDGHAHYYPEVLNISAVCCHVRDRAIATVHIPPALFRPAIACPCSHIELDGRTVERSMPKFECIRPNTCHTSRKRTLLNACSLQDVEAGLPVLQRALK